jgi:hypothetical protein
MKKKYRHSKPEFNEYNHKLSCLSAAMGNPRQNRYTLRMSESFIRWDKRVVINHLDERLYILKCSI